MRKQKPTDPVQRARDALLKLLDSKDERVRLRACIALLQHRRQPRLEDLRFDLGELTGEGPEW